VRKRKIKALLMGFPLHAEVIAALTVIKLFPAGKIPQRLYELG